MRIIHTADWHLGQHFMGKSREVEHRAFLQWLLQHIVEHQIDALIVAGDLYDTGAPPSYARKMYNRFAVDTLKAGCQLVVVGGNHDSAAMLEESSDLLGHLGITQIARPTDNPAHQVIKLYRRGDTEQPAALVCAVPFLRPRDVVTSSAGQDATHKQHQLQTAIAEHYAGVYGAAADMRQALGSSCPIIATGHLTAVGSTRSDSVRDIYIGTLEAFSADGFPPADYIALGHIHSAQKVAGSETIRYSGSPIPLSFDECGVQKSIVQLNLQPGDSIEPQIITVPGFRALHTIRGDLNAIQQQIHQLPDCLGDTATTWLEIVVDTEGYLNDLQQRISSMLEGRNIEVLRIRRARSHNAVSLEAADKQTLKELSVDDIFVCRLDEAFADAATDEQQNKVAAQRERLTLLYRQVVEDIQSSAAQDRHVPGGGEQNKSVRSGANQPELAAAGKAQ